jgi:oligopeptide transport system substrate-binding protein
VQKQIIYRRRIKAMKIFKSREFRAIVASILIASFTAACMSASGGNSAYFGVVRPPEGQVLRYVSGSEPQSLDPQYMTGQPESRIAVALFDGLVEYEVGGIRPTPSLATRWESNANGTVWTFYLRPGVRWTDGEPLDAHDFVYSWRRALSPDLAAAYSSQMHIVRNGLAYNSNMAFVRDPQTGRFATTADLERAGTNGAIQFTGVEPERFDQPARATAPNSPTGNPQPMTTGTRENTPPSTDSTAPANNPAANTQPVNNQIANNQTASTQPAAPPQTEAASYVFVPMDEEERTKLFEGDPATRTPARPELARFVANKELVEVLPEHVGVRALDDLTFQVTLEAPTAYFIKMLPHQFFRPVPQQAIERHGKQLWTRPGNIVTSGAFRLVEWSPYDRIVVERNPMFWDNANTRLDRIVFPSVEELTTIMNLYKAGEIDAMQSNSPPPPWRNQLRERYRDYVFGPYLTVEYLALRTTMPPFNDVRVRRAISMAINRQILADRSPGQQALTSFSPPMEGYRPVQGTDYNPDEARRLLAEAGFPNGQGFPQVEIYYNTAESNRQLMELVHGMLRRELNIPVVMKNVEWRVYLVETKTRTMNYNGIARRGWVGDYVDPNTFFELLLSESDNNGTGWQDSRFDEMIRRANATTDEARRESLLQEAERYMLEHQPVVPLVVKPLAWLRKPYVRNMNPNLLDQHNWRGVYIDHNWREESVAQNETNVPISVLIAPFIGRMLGMM